MEQYAAAAYCSVNYNGIPNMKVTCSSGNCPMVEADATDTLTEFEKWVSDFISSFTIYLLPITSHGPLDLCIP